jgi:transmembrane sensor
LSVAGGGEIDIEGDENLAAARWVLAVEEGLDSEQSAAFHAWLAARPERAELIARQAALQTLAPQLKAAGVGSRRRLLVGVGAAAGMSVLGAALMVRAPWEDESAEYTTATGEVRAFELSDASRLWLDTRTHISTRLTRAQRNVTLETGRVYVEVAHAPNRPFIVRGAHFEARAIGTAFEATMLEARAGVMVMEGVVRLSPPSAESSIDLVAGEGAWIAASGEVTRISAPPPQIAAWRERRMVLLDRRLDEALTELSRYFDRPLTVDDDVLAARRISLSFSIADMDEAGAARIIARAVGADVADRASSVILFGHAALESDASAEPH